MFTEAMRATLEDQLEKADGDLPALLEEVALSLPEVSSAAQAQVFTMSSIFAALERVDGPLLRSSRETEDADLLAALQAMAASAAVFREANDAAAAGGALASVAGLLVRAEKRTPSSRTPTPSTGCPRRFLGPQHEADPAATAAGHDVSAGLRTVHHDPAAADPPADRVHLR